MRTARRERSHAPAPVRVQLPQRPAWLEPSLVLGRDELLPEAEGVAVLDAPAPAA
jgi:hypothetical protein